MLKLYLNLKCRPAGIFSLTRSDIWNVMSLVTTLLILHSSDDRSWSFLYWQVSSLFSASWCPSASRTGSSRWRPRPPPPPRPRPPLLFTFTSASSLSARSGGRRWTWASPWCPWWRAGLCPPVRRGRTPGPAWLPWAPGLPGSWAGSGQFPTFPHWGSLKRAPAISLNDKLHQEVVGPQFEIQCWDRARTWLGPVRPTRSQFVWPDLSSVD